MENIAPGIFRQRLLIEGYYSVEVDKRTIESYLCGLAEHLNLRTYGEPIIYSPGGLGRDENQGFDAFVPLVDSGITVYIWSREKFFSVVIYSCKPFDVPSGVGYTREFFGATVETVHQVF